MFALPAPYGDDFQGILRGLAEQVSLLERRLKTLERTLREARIARAAADSRLAELAALQRERDSLGTIGDLHALRQNSGDQHASPQLAVVPPTTELLLNDLPARSFPHSPGEHTVALRFHLAPADIEELENKRHVSRSDLFTLYIGLDAVVAGVTTYNQVGSQANAEDMPWDLQYGMFSQVLPFWRTNISPALISIERSTWVRDVLPGLGYDRSRLIEMTFPPPLPDHRSAAGEWDKARRALDEQRYSDCVSECRDILAMWQTQLKATEDRPMASVVSDKRGWAEHDGRRSFLDGLWKAAIDIVNAPHHPEGKPAEQAFDAADARLMLTLTAALSRYVNNW